MQAQPHHKDRHEGTDIKVRAILTAGIVLALVLVVALAVSWTSFRILALYKPGGQEPSYAWDSTRVLPPSPWLEIASGQDLAQFRKREDAVLSSYGWIDRENNIIRIPIEEAKAMWLEAHQLLNETERGRE